MNAVHHARIINREIRLAQAMDKSELYSYAKKLQVPVDLLAQTAKLGRLPVVNFAAGGLGKWHNLIGTVSRSFMTDARANTACFATIL